MTGHFVEELIHRFEVEQQKNDRSGIYALTQRMMAYNSNKIEGSTLTEKQTASLFDTGTLSSEDAVIRAKDVEEMTGHFLMFNEMLKTYDLPLSHELIKRYHYKLKSGVFEDLANGYPVGEYKSRRNMVSDIVTALPEEVEGRMTELLEWYHTIPQHTLGDLAKFHADFEAIHPYQDDQADHPVQRVPEKRHRSLHHPGRQKSGVLPRPECGADKGSVWGVGTVLLGRTVGI